MYDKLDKFCKHYENLVELSDSDGSESKENIFTKKISEKVSMAF